ncbi:MAG: cobalamin B12-binding domain-containing protein [Gemmatimonadales bacterium]|nr:MAG: cobalamin B12-binding domain-containing protein [Gemmatimonadales bacterium]
METETNVQARSAERSSHRPSSGDRVQMRPPTPDPLSTDHSRSTRGQEFFLDRRRGTGDGGRSLMFSRTQGIRTGPATEVPLPQPTTSNRLNHELAVGERARFLELIRRVEEAPIEAFIETLVERGVSAERILRDLVTPTARTMGEEWTQDRCTFVDVTLVTGRLQRIVRSLAQIDPLGQDQPESSAPAVLVSSLPRQQHTLGLLVVAEFFRRARWQVTVGPPVGPASPGDVVAGQHIDVLALSLPLIELLPLARKEIRKLRTLSRNPSIGIVVGGPVLLTNPGVVDDVGADASAPEAHLAPEVARAFL